MEPQVSGTFHVHHYPAYNMLDIFFQECVPMDQKLPYYLAYPMPLLYDDEKIERRDFEYMKSLYPAAAKRILPFVEEECDRMQYEGSMMFDEYPDQLQLRLLCSRVYEKVKKEEPEPGNWLTDLIQVIVYQELYKRRCDYRKCKRKFY